MQRTRSLLPKIVNVLVLIVGVASNSVGALAQDDASSIRTSALTSVTLTDYRQAFVTGTSYDVTHGTEGYVVSLTGPSENKTWLLVTLELSITQRLVLKNLHSAEFVNASGARLPCFLSMLRQDKLIDAFNEHGVVFSNLANVIIYPAETREFMVAFEVPDESIFPGVLRLDGHVLAIINESEL